MTDSPPKPSDPPARPLPPDRAPSRWDDEGGTIAGRPPAPLGPDGMSPDSHATPEIVGVPELTDAELVQLRVRVIALENLVIALLAQASDRELALARQQAAHISPRPGFTRHPLTLHAAAHILQLVDRADHLRSMTPKGEPDGEPAGEKGGDPSA